MPPEDASPVPLNVNDKLRQLGSRLIEGIVVVERVIRLLPCRALRTVSRLRGHVLWAFLLWEVLGPGIRSSRRQGTHKLELLAFAAGHQRPCHEGIRLSARLLSIVHRRVKRCRPGQQSVNLSSTRPGIAGMGIKQSAADNFLSKPRVLTPSPGSVFGLGCVWISPHRANFPLHRTTPSFYSRLYKHSTKMKELSTRAL